MIDINTTNYYFIAMKKYLRNFNIKNNNFMLELKNEELKNIDPWNFRLTIQEREKIIDEAKNNIYYYLREIVRIRTNDGNLVRCKLNPATLAQVFLYDNRISNWNSTCRESNKTVMLALLSSYEVFKYKDEKINLITRSKNDFLLFMQKINELIALPYYFYDNNIINNNINFINISDIERVNEARISIYDETEFIKDLYSIFQNIRKNSINCNHIELFASTVADNKTAIKNGVFDIWSDYFCPWNNVFYDIIDNDINTNIKSKYKDKIFYINYDYNELGFSEEWADKMELLLDKNIFKSEILNIRKYI